MSHSAFHFKFKLGNTQMFTFYCFSQILFMFFWWSLSISIKCSFGEKTGTFIAIKQKFIIACIKLIYARWKSLVNWWPTYFNSIHIHISAQIQNFEAPFTDVFHSESQKNSNGAFFPHQQTFHRNGMETATVRLPRFWLYCNIYLLHLLFTEIRLTFFIISFFSLIHAHTFCANIYINYSNVHTNFRGSLFSLFDFFIFAAKLNIWSNKSM